ncbi:MAG: GtrA family protein, partial [Chloroflexi bacterium]|nr:GtrA family protein [Chloroflexota bacterium]
MGSLVSKARAYAQANPAEVKRFAKFATVGAIGAVVDFGILNLGIQVFGLEKWLANVFSFTAAVISNFTWNRLWTYPESRAQPLLSQLGQFGLVNLVGLGINEVIFL